MPEHNDESRNLNERVENEEVSQERQTPVDNEQQANEQEPEQAQQVDDPEGQLAGEEVASASDEAEGKSANEGDTPYSSEETASDEGEVSKKQASGPADESIELEKDPDDVDEEGEEEETDDEAVGEASLDYSGYNKDQLINTFRKILPKGIGEDIRPQIEAIKANFYKIHNAELEEQKKAFMAEGGAEEDFQPTPDPYENDLKDLLKEFKNLRTEYHRRQEVQKEENYQKKLEIIDELKALINKEESINATFQEFNALQSRWRELGQVPQGKVKDLWENYHHHVENFYDYIKINRELRDLDLKKNMDKKVGLCDRAEALAEDESNPVRTFRQLQKLHENWREIGPIPRENKQELWERFKAATTVINKRYQQYFEEERAKQKENLEKKVELCERAEEFANFDSTNPREWNEMTEKIIALQKKWKTIGFAPRKDNTLVWERFRAANDTFFRKKRDFWAKSKEKLHDNLAQKIEICEQAEELKESTDWKGTTDKLIALQTKWKAIGPVPRKQSDLVWKRFRAACDEFFNRKGSHFSGMTEEQEGNLKAKKAIIKEVGNFKPSGDVEADVAILSEFQERWKSTGRVPFRRKDDVESKFRDAINDKFDQIEMDEQERNLHKFRNKMVHWMTIPRGWGRINSERDRNVLRIKQLESDLGTLQNNIGFFGDSKGAQSLAENVQSKIDRITSQIDYLKSKIEIIDELGEESR
ncbi:DUF349 domain-containing protein [Prolixibacter sp. SD074]|uniref:DUF349 domain-containing protein n=1 Tax=Prolixibacter sp. SD074 TaxID=2652391 RepID=UPI00128AD74B|nr:DUF349 domain-containing protein [Prolixibacter sp. SD074]GET29067.1 hypothetical protein SD074_12690 [Prolixibacter sp. SD074]